ncbi:MAG: GTPase Era, partial [Candidatus Euphemobacter frigidus]|nr:GTPase Era [Candidatus Euphemobacter frigidus]
VGLRPPSRAAGGDPGGKPCTSVFPLNREKASKSLRNHHGERKFRCALKESLLKNTVETRCGFVSLAGEPNVGKSTLMNRLIGENLAIVSPKPQTTWQVVRGILTTPKGQIIFVDTPGIHRSRDALGSQMVSAARSAIFEADLNYWIIDCRKGTDLSGPIFGDHLPLRIPVFLLINKVDLFPRPRLLPLINRLQEHYPFKEIIPISALKGENVDRLLEVTWKYLPVGPLLFPPDQLSDQPEREIVKEFIREQVFLITHQEIPYSTAVTVEEMRERPGRKKLFISAIIYVERKSQKGIIVGKNGAMIKRIGTYARSRIEGLLGVPVYLELRVKVRENWRRKSSSLREFGYN